MNKQAVLGLTLIVVFLQFSSLVKYGLADNLFPKRGSDLFGHGAGKQTWADSAVSLGSSSGRFGLGLLIP